MTFFEFKEKDILSIVYTAYPTRSLNLNQFGSNDGYSLSVYPHGPTTAQVGLGNPGTNRTYFDINGNYLTSTFDAKNTIYLWHSQSLSSSYKNAINRLRNIYASSSFQKPENYTSSSVYTPSLPNTIGALSIPTWYIGSGIKPGSLTITKTDGTKVYFSDDGFGGLISGSRLVGSIFYQHGLVYFGHLVNRQSFESQTAITLNFSATNNIPTNVYLCDVPKSYLNFSLNPSYTVLTGSRNEITTEDPKTFITTIALYDENFEVVGIAKVSTPIKNEEGDGALFKLKMAF